MSLRAEPAAARPLLPRFPGVPDDAFAPRLSAGSGFIVDARRGLVITNNHIVENARAIEVPLDDGTVQARLLGIDPTNDIAVLQIRRAAGSG